MATDTKRKPRGPKPDPDKLHIAACAATSIMEHFDSVLILVTYSDSKTTHIIECRRGNDLATESAVTKLQWLNYNDND